MTALTQASIQALLRLRSYVPPKSCYDLMPLTRRAAVLLLLFPDTRGELKVVLTLRSETLRHFAGQVAFPGGKADTLTETARETARREAYEEIGLPLPSHRFILPGVKFPSLAAPQLPSASSASLAPTPATAPNAVPPNASQTTKDLEQGQSTQPARVHFTITHLTELPCSLSRTNLAVRPCVAVLLPAPKPSPSASPRQSRHHEPYTDKLDPDSLNTLTVPFDIESLLIPRLNPQEVAAVFSVPLESFLSKAAPQPPFHPPVPPHAQESTRHRHPKWYSSHTTHWYGKDWIMHEFFRAARPEERVGAIMGGKPLIPGMYNDKMLSPEQAIALRKERAGFTDASGGGVKSTGDGGGGGGNLSGKTAGVLQGQPTGPLQQQRQHHHHHHHHHHLKPYRIWGMTSRILVDAARIAYGREPDFDCLEEKGDEEMIEMLWEYGVLKEERRHGEDYAVVELYNRLEGWAREKRNL